MPKTCLKYRVAEKKELPVASHSLEMVKVGPCVRLFRVMGRGALRRNNLLLLFSFECVREINVR